MSSSRSIAAARQKRASEQSSNTNNNSGRPVTSISSSSVFSQQPNRQNSFQGNVKYNQVNTQGRQRIGQNQTPIQIPNQSQSQQQQQKQLTKISVPDAIGLITLRLGKLEKFIQDSIEDGNLPFMTNNNEDYESNGMKLVTDEVFENITNRLDNLEKKNNNNISSEQVNKIAKDIQDLKDSINTLNMKLSSFISESQERFVDFEAALVEIEKNIDVSNNENELLDNENNDVNDEYIDDDTQNIVSETIEDSISTTDFIVEGEITNEEN